MTVSVEADSGLNICAKPGSAAKRGMLGGEAESLESRDGWARW